MEVGNKKQAEIIVYGDVMLDEYLWGDVRRVSPEAPVPVVNLEDREYRLGGAANVALNIRRAGVSVSIFGCVGNDSAGKRLKMLTNEHGITCNFLHGAVQTTTKTRIMAMGHQLLRVDQEEICDKKDARCLLKGVVAKVHSCKVVVISDYFKGVILDISTIVKEAAKYSIPVIVDPKSSNLESYRSAFLITPNLKEFRAFSCFDPTMSIYENAVLLSKRFDIKWIVVTMGAQGLLAVNKDGESYQVDSSCKEVIDVTGAGDAVLSYLAVSIMNNQSIEDALILANKAAGITVSRLGTVPVSIEEVRQLDKNKSFPLSDRIGFAAQIQSIKAMNKTIVMTNGCFDILHPGHIDYLKRSKQYGDFLVVALNSDESISFLKGSSRPINDFLYRSKMLSCVVEVDLIVEFSESTPENLIKICAPDVLTKGSDYNISEVAGGKSVIDSGGRVVLIDFLDGYSTTKTIEKIIDKSN